MKTLSNNILRLCDSVSDKNLRIVIVSNLTASDPREPLIILNRTFLEAMDTSRYVFRKIRLETGNYIFLNLKILKRNIQQTRLK